MIAHISDPHLGEPVGRFAFLRRLTGRHDTTHADRLRDAVAALKAHPRWNEIFPVITGDLTDRTTERELQEAEEILAAIGGRLAIVPGNHDATSKVGQGNGFNAENFRAMLLTVERITGRPARFPYALNFFDWRLLCLDSAAHGERGTAFARGRIGQRQLAWLASQLSDQRPTVIALHHYAEELPHVLAISDADEFLAVANRDHVTIINGHRHRPNVYPSNDNRPRIVAAGKLPDQGAVNLICPMTGEIVDVVGF